MNLKYYVVDAFADRVFEGNPAGVCVLDEWLPDELMQSIAVENRLSETAFTVKEGDHYHLRWFTPGGEIDLCGHATLGTAFVVLNFYEKAALQVVFNTLSGELIVKKNGELYEMDFPAYNLKQVDVTDAMEAAIGKRPVEAWMDRDLVCVFDDEDFIVNAEPDQEKIAQLDGLLVHITAKGSKFDCVSRSFGPKLAIPEDPVCGSGHCHIVPLWTDKLGKNEIVARQASSRGGTLYCTLNGERITLAGKASLYLEGEINV